MAMPPATPIRTRDDIKAPSDDAGAGHGLAARLAAEGLGAFFFTFVDAGALILGSSRPDDMPAEARSLASGLLIMAMTYAMGNVSGAHFNPSITLAFALRRVSPWAMVVPYWLAQTVGGALACGLLRCCFGLAHGAGALAIHLGVPPAILIEATCTCMLVVVGLSTATRHKVIGTVAPLAAGGMVALTGLLARAVCDPSTNPARTLGPALVGGGMGEAGWFLLAQAAGTLLAGGCVGLVHPRRHQEELVAAGG